MDGQVGRLVPNSAAKGRSRECATELYWKSMVGPHVTAMQMSRETALSGHALLMESGLHGPHGVSAISNVGLVAKLEAAPLKFSPSSVASHWKVLNRKAKTVTRALAP
jgi:hypothetical protein